ncbi:unnamed protein product [Cuscuta campestris]|uniref:Homeobox-leucine zipper protein n=1 Tax=Cuscuta campestris TaxID=132261 RepID=A0A484LSR4_9ASTE|nr:unnamed protein product [Cuscuta campestris]
MMVYGGSGCQATLEGVEEEEDMAAAAAGEGKKRRLRAEQVGALERVFEEESRLEPERKVKIAGELGLEPRQVAIWFQNRRARFKTKQLERDFNLLKSDYDSLHLRFSKLQHQRDALLSQLKGLKEKLLVMEEKGRGGGEGSPESDSSGGGVSNSELVLDYSGFNLQQPLMAAAEAARSSAIYVEQQQPEYVKMEEAEQQMVGGDFVLVCKNVEMGILNLKTLMFPMVYKRLCDEEVLVGKAKLKGSGDVDRIKFHIGDRIVEFKKSDFALITGLKFGKEAEYGDTDLEKANDISSRYFNGKMSVTRIQVENVFNSVKNSRGRERLDAIKLALLNFLVNYVVGNQGLTKIPALYMHLVDDLRRFNGFQWGEHLWNDMVESLRKCSSILNTGEHCRFTFPGFLFPLQIWAFETFPSLRENGICIVGQKRSSLWPRALRWETDTPFLALMKTLCGRYMNKELTIEQATRNKSVRSTIMGGRMEYGRPWQSVDFVYMPLNTGNHWTLLVLDIKKKLIRTYDSSRRRNDSNRKLQPFLPCLQMFLPKIMDKLGVYDGREEGPLGDEVLAVEAGSCCPQQADGSSCGMFVVKMAEFLMMGCDVGDMDDHKIAAYRKKMTVELLAYSAV